MKHVFEMLENVLGVWNNRFRANLLIWKGIGGVYCSIDLEKVQFENPPKIFTTKSSSLSSYFPVSSLFSYFLSFLRFTFFLFFLLFSPFSLLFFPFYLPSWKASQMDLEFGTLCNPEGDPMYDMVLFGGGSIHPNIWIEFHFAKNCKKNILEKVFNPIPTCKSQDSFRLVRMIP